MGIPEILNEGSERTAEEIFRLLLDGIALKAWADLPRLYSEDAVVEQPFAALPGLALRGRHAIAAHFAAAANAPFSIEPCRISISPTVDPEVIFAEYDYRLRNERTGFEVTTANIQRLRVRHGRIVHSRDYHDYRALEAAAAG